MDIRPHIKLDTVSTGWSLISSHSILKHYLPQTNTI